MGTGHHRHHNRPRRSPAGVSHVADTTLTDASDATDDNGHGPVVGRHRDHACRFPAAVGLHR